jgi:formyl-CoA transferase
MLLADLGAEVTKVEGPAGDTLRAWPPHTAPDDGAPAYSENFASLNRNKRSITLDLKDPAQRDAALALVAEADVLVENNRPGVMERLGLGAAACRAVNPRLIYCSISAYGQTGPRAQQGGFDVTIQAISGVMSVTGEPDGAPVKCGVPVADFTAGLYGAMAVSAALRRVAATGEGCHIDVPMMGATLAIAALQTSEYFGSVNAGRARDPVKLGSAHPRNAPYQAFKAADDFFVMAAGTQALWLTVCDELQRADLAADPRFATTSLRAANQAALKAELERTFAQDTAASLIQRLAARGVPCVPIQRYSEVLADPQTQASGWVEALTLPNGAVTQTVGTPLRFDGQRAQVRQGPPALGTAKVGL